MGKRCSVLIAIILLGARTVAFAQDPNQIIGPMIDFMNQAMQQAARQNSPEYQDQQVQPGGLTKGQVIIVQQLLAKEGYDVGPPDGEVGPKTRAAVAIAQHKARVPITGLPDQQLLDALLGAQ